MRILIINWRSVKDPLEGGAERATIEHARRWVKNHQAEVTWLSPRYDMKIDRETIDGINFVYIGFPLKRNISEVIFTFPFFYLSVIWTYLTKFKGKVDVVIDQVHGIPYLTPLYVKEKIVVYIHEVAGEIWDIMYPFPINKIGRFLEKIIYPPYKNIDFVGANTVSKQLLKIGIKKSQITTINYGITVPLIDEVPQKNKDLTVIFLNRLVKMKGPERTIELFEKIHQLDKNARLIFAGKGEPKYVQTLVDLISQKGLTKNVTFKGFVSEKEKFDLLSSSHVLVNASYKEGWGLVNIEANAMGTPAVSFNVEGNTESIKPGVSGFIFDPKDLDQMAQKIVSLKDNEKIRKSALDYSKQFNWDKVSDKFYEVLAK